MGTGRHGSYRDGMCTVLWHCPSNHRVPPWTEMLQGTSLLWAKHHQVPASSSHFCPEQPQCPCLGPSLDSTSRAKAMLPAPAPSAQRLPSVDELSLLALPFPGFLGCIQCLGPFWLFSPWLSSTLHDINYVIMFFWVIPSPYSPFSCQVANMLIIQGAHIKVKLPWCSSFHMLFVSHRSPVCPLVPFISAAHNTGTQCTSTCHQRHSSLLCLFSAEPCLIAGALNVYTYSGV